MLMLLINQQMSLVEHFTKILLTKVLTMRVHVCQQFITQWVV
ncbi:hypothetical protein SDC9_210118 [bioreactor metagenome]|uniref:Uncharacterized protein n=1 Tax=bioreactor metagenome TaxID=1076179 RepID=A0A645JFI8_9ZZZZ